MINHMSKNYLIYLFTPLFSLTLLLPAKAQDFKRSAITDPSISRRCKELIDQRQKKIVHKQKLKALLVRNAKLQKISPRERKSVLEKLQRNHRNLRHELKYTEEKIKNQEENIIRKGCPGIQL